MTLDLIITTYNRAELLERLLDSVRRARRPPNLHVRTIVVDNNSTDDTRSRVVQAQRMFPDQLDYRLERVQGKVYALNHGLSLAVADLVGMVDDDEEIHVEWLEVIARVFRDPALDFIAGPYLPRWGAPAPGWLPKAYPAVVGWVEAGDQILQFGQDEGAGVPLGGNTVVRRAVGEKVGWYDEALGNIGATPGGCEDVDFFERLLLAGASGFYRPDLIVYHYIPASRLTKRYHRRWCFHRAWKQSRVDARRPQPVAHLCGIPRYLIGRAIRSSAFLVGSPFGAHRDPSIAFSHELAFWELAGYIRGSIGAAVGGSGAPGTPGPAGNDARDDRPLLRRHDPERQPHGDVSQPE